MKYAVIVEKGARGHGAYVSDLPGCIATAPTYDEALRRIKGAIEFHIEGLRETGQPVPLPAPTSEQVEATGA